MAYEQKLDGHRALLFTAAVPGGTVLVQTRRGALVQEWPARGGLRNRAVAPASHVQVSAPCPTRPGVAPYLVNEYIGLALSGTGDALTAYSTNG
ncbi:hypothetical protein ACFV30_35560 [Streptomyces sp. NPDC059752]|uniref:hypothetical protein n=1 Tax=unclassified Streptomyces TaxID=2593676 RepID=UPI0036536699